MYKLFMAFRYLRAHKIIYFSIAGVAIGIMTMVIVISVMAGFSRDMRARIRGMQAHIVITPAVMTQWIADYDGLCDRLRKVPGVVAAAPRIEWEAWLGRQGDFRDVHIVGIDPAREREASDLEAYFLKGSKRAFDFNDDYGRETRWPGVVLGAELRWGGAQLGLMTARQANTPAFFAKDFQNVGYFRSGMSEYDSKYVFMDLKAAQDFLQVGRSAESRPLVNTVTIRVEDYERRGREIRNAILEALHAHDPCDDAEFHRSLSRCGRFQVLTWEQTRRVLLQAVEVEKGIQMLLLFLIVLVAGFNIIAIYTLVVRSKTRDIGILRALGATEGGVTSVFLMSGGLCGLFGSFFGIGLGLLLSRNLNEIEDVIRVVSRDVNRISPGLQAASLGSLVVALAALLWTWIGFYQDRPVRPWLRVAVSTVAIALAYLLSTTWMPEYRSADHYDPGWTPGSRWVGFAGVIGFWAAFMLAWRGLAPLRRRPGWIFFGFGGTIVLIAYLVAILAPSIIVEEILRNRPDYGWLGIELFPKTIYYLDRIPVYVDVQALVYIVAVTLAVSVVFSIYPALRAATANPIEAIRDE
jgi:lipoprotein-releasing system permease protein